MPIMESLRDRTKRALSSAVASAVASVWEKVCTGGIIGHGHPRAMRFAEFGEGSLISFPPGTIFNEQWIAIGKNAMIGPRVSLSVGMVPGQPIPSSSPMLLIGDRCIIGQGSYIVAHDRIFIGDDVQMGPYVYITDQNHGYENPDLPIGTQWPVNKEVTIGAGSWIGTGAIILPGTTIGNNVVIGAGSVVTGKIPDRCVVVGAPARIVRRYVPGNGWERTTANSLMGSSHGYADR
jgi:carbonic anhydrase/acetyltransferase-like protein (isoleucine patch superfamily)